MKLEKICATEVRRLAYALAFAFAAAVPHALPADDLTLAAGESQTISESGTYSYDTITVNGSLTISGSGVNVTAVKVLVAEGAGETGELTVKDGATLTVTGVWTQGTTVYPFSIAHATASGASNSATGTVCVLNGAAITTHDLVIANMEQCVNTHSVASLCISNATVTVSAKLFSTRGRAYEGYDGTWFPATVTLDEGAVFSIGGYTRNATSKTLFLFKGGKVAWESATSSDGGTLVLKGDGSPIDITCTSTSVSAPLFYVNSGNAGVSGKVLLSGNGGLTVRGSVRYRVSAAIGSGAENTDVTADYIGPLTIVNRGLVQTASGQVCNGQNALDLSAASDPVFDLNGYDAAFTSIDCGNGFIRNSSDTAATLTIGGGDADGTLTKLVGPLGFRKIGSGTWTVYCDDIHDVAVDGGVLNLGSTDIVGYRYWKFHILETYGANRNSIQLGEFSLLDADGNLLDFSTRTSMGGSFSSDQLAKLADGDLTTTCWGSAPDSTTTHYAQYGFEVPFAAAKYRWSTAHDYGPDTKWENNPSHSSDLVPPAYDVSQCRDPSAWTLEGSNDGSHWHTIDSVAGFKAINARYTWNSTNFVCSSYPDLVLPGAVAVADGATLRLLGKGTISPQSWINEGTAVFPEGSVYSLDGTLPVLRDICSGVAAEKTGEDTVKVLGGVFAGRIHVAEGALFVSGNDGAPQKRWRWRMKQLRSESTLAFQLQQLALYDKTGRRVNLTADGTTYTAKPVPRNGNAASLSNAFGKLFSGDEGRGKECFLFVEEGGSSSSSLVRPDPANESTWSSVEFVLPESMGNVFSYRLMTAKDHAERDVIAWDLACSDDGETWMIVSDVLDATATEDRLSWTAYNGGDAFMLDVGTDANVLVPGTEVQVDGGAVLAFAGAATVIDKLRIDFAEGAGTLSHFNPAANGELRLENVPAGANLSALALLSVGTAVNAANLSSWAVWVDDSPSPYRLLVRNGSLALLPAGTIMIVR